MNASTSMPMDYIKRILVIVDPTATAHPSIDKAALLAEKFNARLELFVCDTKAAREMRLASHVRAHPGAPLPTNIKGELEALAAPLRQRGLDVTTETACAEPLHVGLIDRIRHTSTDLVVKDTHHHSLAQRTFLTNTDWQLIRACPVPLLLTKARHGRRRHASWQRSIRVMSTTSRKFWTTGSSSMHRWSRSDCTASCTCSMFICRWP